jgi:hypothetical protein
MRGQAPVRSIFAHYPTDRLNAPASVFRQKPRVGYIYRSILGLVPLFLHLQME